MKAATFAHVCSCYLCERVRANALPDSSPLFSKIELTGLVIGFSLIATGLLLSL